MTKRHNLVLLMTFMNDTVNDKKRQNIVNDSFAHKPDGLLVCSSGIVKVLFRLLCTAWFYFYYFVLPDNITSFSLRQLGVSFIVLMVE